MKNTFLKKIFFKIYIITPHFHHIKGRVLTWPAFLNSLINLDSSFILSKLSMCLNHVAQLEKTVSQRWDTELIFITESDLAAHCWKK